MSLISLFIEKLRYLPASIKCLKRGKAYYCVYIQLLYVYHIYEFIKNKNCMWPHGKMCLKKRGKEKKKEENANWGCDSVW